MSEPTALAVGVPSRADLERLYHELARLGASSVGRPSEWRFEPESAEELLAIAGDMLRYDARLLSVLVELVLTAWPQWNPLELRRQMKRMRWPRALLVAFEFGKAAGGDPELRYFGDYLGAGYDRRSGAERFFIDGPKPGSRTELRQRGRSLVQYSRWGFLGTERPAVDAVSKETVGSYDAATRLRIRRSLVSHQPSFSLSDYLDAVDHSISRQQAYADLKGDAAFEVVGRGRGARWRLVQR